MKTHSAKLVWWEVWSNGRCIDEVPYTADCDKEYVRRSLIEHDGYDPSILVRKAR